ncbi:hypothetical protein [Streptomyces griseosporeus]|uniref:hypothetical protein n=1 Tax=Streptomyces griseosporeus TaxID=1910 RepID=UPI0036F913B1
MQRARSWASMILIFGLSILAVSCGESSDEEVPQAICGTRIDPDLTRPLLTSNEDLHESNKVDRAEATSGPCTVLSKEDAVLEFHFYWAADAPNLELMARNKEPLGVTEVRNGAVIKGMLIGDNGAIATSPCRTQTGEHFTLALQVSQLRVADRSLRKSIENFMRSYFPATLKTLDCS